MKRCWAHVGKLRLRLQRNAWKLDGVLFNGNVRSVSGTLFHFIRPSISKSKYKQSYGTLKTLNMIVNVSIDCPKLSRLYCVFVSHSLLSDHTLRFLKDLCYYIYFFLNYCVNDPIFLHICCISLSLIIKFTVVTSRLHCATCVGITKRISASLSNATRAPITWLNRVIA